MAYCFCGQPVREGRRLYCSYVCCEIGTRAAHYGITPAAYIELLRQQGGRCALCRQRLGDEFVRPVIDHDHTTNAVRGVLCQACNLRLAAVERVRREGGSIKSKPRFFDRALRYLDGTLTFDDEET